MRPRCTMLCVMLVGLFLPAAANAQPSYQFVFDQDIYRVPPNEKVDAMVYLQEAVGAGDTAVLDEANAIGMFSVGVKLRFDEAVQPSHPAKVPDNAAVAANAAFDQVTKGVTSGNAELVLAALDNPFVYGTEGPTNVYRMLVGTFTFTAGSEVGEETPISVTDADPNLDDTVTSGFQVLDGSIRDGAASILVVPEPGTLVLLATAILGLVGYASMRRRYPDKK